MPVLREVKRVGGSLAVMIPRDIAESMRVTAGSPVMLTLVNDQLVVEPTHEYADDASFNRAFATVLRQHGATFQWLAEFDRGLHPMPGKARPKAAPKAKPRRRTAR